MKEVIKSAKTIKEAVDEALSELGLTEDEVEIEVLQEPNKGLFGLLGVRDAKVRVTAKEKSSKPQTIHCDEPEAGASEKKALKTLKEIFACMKIDVEMDLQESGDYTKINLTGPDLGILIGRRGDTLDALQYYINLVANRKAEKRIRIVLDIEGYRERRAETLHKLAFRLADKARRKGKDVVLEPMNPHERRIIHTALQDHRDVFTYSEGEEPYRKIVIAPKK